MRRIGLVLLFLLAPLAAQAAEERYRIDPSHTRVIFMVSHVGFSNMIGRFNAVSGEYTLDEDAPEKGRAEVTIETGSVDTGDATLDDILRGPDFFAAKAHPQIRFRSTAVERSGEQAARLWGELTLRGVTRPVTLDVTFNRKGIHPLLGPFGPTVSGFSARTTIDRRAFGMTALGGLVGDQVLLLIEVEGHKQ
jgi:polyisoprenoid-binding protein YceI